MVTTTPESKPPFTLGLTCCRNTTIQELIRRLRSSFLESEFDNVQEILIARESNLMCKLDEMSRDVEKRRNDCDLMEKRQKDLALLKIDLEDELQRHVIERDVLKERVTMLNEEMRLFSEKEKLNYDRERKWEERYAKLLEEFDRKESERKEMILKLRNEVDELKCANREKESYISELNLRHGELDSRVSQLEKDIEILLEKPTLELGVTADKEGIQSYGACAEQVARKKNLVVDEETVNENDVLADNASSELLHSHAIDETFLGTANVEPPKDIRGTCRFSAKGKDEQEEDLLLLDVNCGTVDLVKTLSSAVNRKSRFSEIIDISDDDAQLPESIRFKHSGFGLDENGRTSLKSPEGQSSRYSDGKGRSFTNDCTSFPTLKRKCTSGFESDGGDEHSIAIGKGKMRRMEDLINDTKPSPFGQPKPVFVQLCEEANGKDKSRFFLSSSDSSDSSSEENGSDAFMNNLIGSL